MKKLTKLHKTNAPPSLRLHTSNLNEMKLPAEENVIDKILHQRMRVKSIKQTSLWREIQKF